MFSQTLGTKLYYKASGRNRVELSNVMINISLVRLYPRLWPKLDCMAAKWNCVKKGFSVSWDRLILSWLKQINLNDEKPAATLHFIPTSLFHFIFKYSFHFIGQKSWQKINKTFHINYNNIPKKFYHINVSGF